MEKLSDSFLGDKHIATSSTRTLPDGRQIYFEAKVLNGEDGWNIYRVTNANNIPQRQRVGEFTLHEEFRSAWSRLLDRVTHWPANELTRLSP